MTLGRALESKVGDRPGVLGHLARARLTVVEDIRGSEGREAMRSFAQPSYDGRTEAVVAPDSTPEDEEVTPMNLATFPCLPVAGLRLYNNRFSAGGLRMLKCPCSFLVEEFDSESGLRLHFFPGVRTAPLRCRLSLRKSCIMCLSLALKQS